MEIEFDPDKEAANLAKHGISLKRAASISIVASRRVVRNGEPRLKAMGYIDGQLYAMVCVFRPNSVRVISLRRARPEELDRE